MRPGAHTFIVAVVLALGLPALGHALDLSDIETQIRRNVRDTATSGNRYTDAILLDWINEEQRDIVNMTWCVMKSTTVSLVAGTTYYDMPTDFIASSLVRFTQTGKATVQLKELMLGSLVDDNPDFERSNTGPPINYFTRLATDGDDTTEMAMVPVPVSGSTGTVKIEYFAQGTDLSSDSDVPFGGFLSLIPYHYTIVAGVTARIKAIESKPTEAAYYQQERDRLVAIMQQRMSESPNYRAGVRAVGR